MGNDSLRQPCGLATETPAPGETRFPALAARSVRVALLVVAGLYVLAYLFVVCKRIGYPFELEWMEGASVDQVARVISGQKLYVSPSLEFVPLIYGPLYFYVSAIVAGITGIGFLPLRLVSLLSSLVSFLMIYLMVKRETGSSFLGALSASLFAATFRISGAWFDIARVDALFLALLLTAFYLVRFKESLAYQILAGVLVSLSFLTKQVALLIVLPAMLYSVLAGGRRSAFFVLSAVATAVGSTLLLNRVHAGWFNYYMFVLPSQHPIVKTAWASFWTRDMASLMLFAFILSAVYFVWTRDKTSRRPRFFYGAMAAGMLAGAWFSRLHYGGYDNVLIPAYAAMSILFGLGAGAALALVQKMHAGMPRRGIAETGICLVCIAQFLLLRYNPLRQIPSREDLEAGRDLVSAMAQIRGDVLLAQHGYLPALAGKKCFAHQMAIFDIVKAKPSPTAARLVAEIRQAIRQRRFAAIILDGPYVLQEEVDNCYSPERPVFQSRTVFWTVAGMRTRPEVIFVPKPTEVAGSQASDPDRSPQ